MSTYSSGPWWPAPAGPNSMAGIPRSRKNTASEAPSRPTAGASPPSCDRTASRSMLDMRLARGRGPPAAARRAGSPSAPSDRSCRSTSSGSWFGQVADVDVHAAVVGHDVHDLAAADAADVDRRPRRTARELAGRERQLEDPLVEVERPQDGVLAQPRRRAVGAAAARRRSAPPARPWTGRRSRGSWARRTRRSRRGGPRRPGTPTPWPAVESSSDSSSGTISSFTLTPGIVSRQSARSASAASIAARAPFMS